MNIQGRIHGQKFDAPGIERVTRVRQESIEDGSTLENLLSNPLLRHCRSRYAYLSAQTPCTAPTIVLFKQCPATRCNLSLRMVKHGGAPNLPRGCIARYPFASPRPLSSLRSRLLDRIKGLHAFSRVENERFWKISLAVLIHKV